MPGGKIDILVEPDLRGFPNKLASGLRGASTVASTMGKGLGLALAAGTGAAAVGLKSVIQLGNEYQGNLNELQAVSGATALQMEKVGQTAKALGADMTLPATSAADAANAMVELAKGGLSVDEAMQAAKGTLQLAAAAQVDGATAAELQSAALNSFGLAADQAGRVADVLANTANASASSMIDVGNSLKYVAPVSAALKVSIEDTAAAIGLLANQGIKGEQAGTSLRGIIASLASPSKQAKEAMDALGISAFDAQGKFVGLRKFTDQLAQAKKRLSDAEFAAAASTAFGNEGFTAANALAAEGATAFDQMATSVSRAGGAADVAAARTKGLGGAWEGFKSQLETAGIEVYEVIAPGLERAVRAGADFVARFTPTVISGLEQVIAVGELFGPDLGRAIASRGDALADSARELVAPLVDGVLDTLNSAVNVGTTVFRGFANVIREGAEAVEPLATGVGDLLENLDKAGGPVGVLVSGLELVYDVTSGIIDVVTPVVGLVGDLVGLFGDLPGPVQSVAIALAALRFGPALLGGLRSALSGVRSEADGAATQTGLLGRSMGLVLSPVRLAASGMTSMAGTVRQFSDEARANRIYAAQAGEAVGVLGSYTAAFNTSTIPAIASARSFAEQTSAIRAGAAASGQPISVLSAAMGTLAERTPALQQMRTAYDRASEGASRFSRTAGLAAAAASGMRSAASGLVGALGGPWGAALAGATLALSALASAQEASARRAAENAAGQVRYRDALIDSNGAVNDHIRSMIRLDLVQGKAAPGLKDIGVSMDEAVDAIIRGGPAFDELRDKINAQSSETSLWDGVLHTAGISTDENVAKQHELAGVLGDLRGQFEGATQDQQDFAAGADEAGTSMLTASDTGRSLADAMGVLADNTSTADDKARALKDALDALSGGNITLEQSQSRVNEQLDQLSSKFGENIDTANGWGKALLNANGSVNTTTENGRFLLDTLDDLGASTADLAQKTFDTAIAQGDTMPVALEKARKAAQGVRAAFVAQADQLGLTTEQVQLLADRYGIVPDDVVTLIQTPGMTKAQTDMVILKQKIGDVPAGKTVTVTGLTEAAVKKLEDIGFRVRTLPDGSFQVSANTKTANDVLNGLARKWNGYTIYLNTAIRGRNNQIAQLGGGLGGAVGGIVETYAQGGIRKLTPLDGRIAHRVPANTWRVIGDRPRGLEYYLPDDDKPRTMAIGAEWARRRGLVLVRKYAEGGINVPDTPDSPAGPRVSRSGGNTAVMPVGVNVEQLTIRAYSDRFSLKQVQDNLAAYGIS